MNKERIRKLNDAGFTLVELVVVLVLITILLGVGAAGIVAYQDQAHRIMLDDTAENLFTAAQSRLTRMYSSGDLPHWQKMLKNDGAYRDDLAVPVIDLADTSFSPDSNYITRSQMLSDDTFNTQGMLQDSYSIWQDNEEGHVLLALRAAAGDYDKYMNNPGELGKDTLFLFALLTEEVTDPEVLNSAICIEIAPEDAQIFSVFFSTDAESFGYLGREEGVTGQVDISRREYTSREKKSIGYFGVERLTHVCVQPPEDLDLGSLVVENGDTLNYHLYFDGEVEEDAPSRLDYTLTIYDQSGKKLLVFTFSGGEIDGKKQKITENYVYCDTVRYDFDQNETELGKYPLPIYWERKGTETVPGLSFILDAADATAATALLDGTEAEAKDIRYGGQQNGSFVNSLSFFRFGTWTEMEATFWTDSIYAEITTVDSGDGLSGLEGEATATSDATNPYFEELVSTGSDEDRNNKEIPKSALISNPRHLYNIRYFEDLEWGKLGVTGNDSGSEFHNRMTYRLGSNIDWADFAKRSYYATPSTKIQGIQGINDKATDFSFPSIRQLRRHKLPGNNRWSYDLLSGDNGTDKSFAVSGLTIKKRDNTAVRDYEGYAPDEFRPTGLFLVNNGIIEHFAMDRFYVEGEYRVGAICGVNNGTLSYCETRSTRDADHTDASLVAGIEDVGGVFGLSGRTGDVYYTQLKNEARVSGKLYVGGITGRLVNGSGVNLIGFEACNNSGQILASEADAAYIGGIVGYIKNDGRTVTSCYLKDCHSLPEYSNVYDKDIYDMVHAIFGEKHSELTYEQTVSANMLNAGDYVGGIAGFAKDVYFVSCSSTAPADQSVCGVIFGRDYVGGIVGLCAGRFDENNKTSNNLAVCGTRYVGGIAGCTASVSMSGNRAIPVESATDVKVINIYGASNLASVFALKDYAGGLVGLSYGGVKSNSVGVEGTAVKISGRNYVGSICGRHRGNQEMGYPTRFECNVDGENYVGGLVGFIGAEDQRPYNTRGTYQGQTPFVDFYGTVYGNGCYVGGLFGAIANSDLLDQGKYRCRADEVSGNYYVGGAVGAVVINESDTVNMKYDVRNLKSGEDRLKIRATAFAGGYAGFTATSAASGIALDQLLDGMGNTGMNDALTLTIAQSEQLERHKAFQGNWIESGTIKLNGLYTDNMYGLQVASISPLDEQKGLVHVGGLIGANGENSILLIEGINMTRANNGFIVEDKVYSVGTIKPGHIMESFAVFNEDVHHYEYQSVGFSYAGPLIGVNTENSVIRSSYMDCVMDTPQETYYHGGMCEINDGYIEWKTDYTGLALDFLGWQAYFAPDLTKVDHVGGLCGLNRGTIQLNHSPRLVVSGRDVVGGLAAENMEGATIKLSVGQTVILKQCVVTAEGSIAGGVVGRNCGDVVCTDTRDIKLCRGVKIKGKSLVGGYIGEQIGGLDFSRLHIGHNDATDKGAEVYATGSDDGVAGGIIGRLVVLPTNEPFKLHNCDYTQGDDLAIVHGKYAGGLIGEVQIESEWENEQIVQIYNCKIYGKVVSEGTGGAAGGIIGRVVTGPNSKGEIEVTDCRISATLSQTNGNTAGIVCDGGSWVAVDKCRVYSASAKYAITAKNARAVTNCLAKHTYEDFAGLDTAGRAYNDYYRNNYCISGSLSTAPTNLQEPSGTMHITDIDLYIVKNKGNDHYAYWTDTNADTLKVFKMMNSGTSDNDVDSKFLTYLGGQYHYYDSPYVR
ncbi:MAG: prepilin-type N-terminal cleavage/methylation domain-containing protein [Lachnospiraceae bacterium]|nr:prepilin-type N-terminal cleavage/methylation domain-containing protein [Lachnospiraceae bacterium]